MPNPWDSLSALFNVHKNINEVDTKAADNILIAWPRVIARIQARSGEATNMSLLDYGCGTGAFCEKLRALGFTKVAGMDSSARMIEQAKKNYSERIVFLEGSADSVLSIEPVDIITGIMVFQFIKNIEQVFKNLVHILKPGGLFIFAVHNPATVKASIQRGGVHFTDFESTAEPHRGLIHIKTATIPIYIRASSEYDQIMQPLGMTKISEEYPVFTEEFLSKYGTELPHDIPEYLILAYRKSSTLKNMKAAL